MSPGSVLRDLPLNSFVRVADLPGPVGAAYNAVSRAAARGDLVKVSRGLYFKGIPTRYGMTKPDAETVARAALEADGVGPAGVSAARALGLTTQVPTMPEMAVTGPVSTAIKGVKLHRRNNMERRSLNYLEIAVLEVLRDWEFTVESGWPGLIQSAAKLVKEGRVRPDRLRAAASREPNPKVRDGVRILMDAGA